MLKDPWFDWLHRLSELIVQIDESLDSHDSETPATEADATALIERAKTLLAPAETGSRVSEKLFPRVATVAGCGVVALGDYEAAWEVALQYLSNVCVSSPAIAARRGLRSEISRACNQLSIL